MGVQVSLINRAMPIIRNRGFAIIERGRITAFLREPCQKNLPSQIKTNVLHEHGGKVFLCHAPDGRRIFLKTKYKSEVIISLRYESGNVFAELRAVPSQKKASESFLVKEGGKIYHEGKKVDPETLKSPRIKYRGPKIFSRTKSDKIERGHQIERWLRNKGDIPGPYLTKIPHRGHIQLCSYMGEPVLPLLGAEFEGRTIRVSFEEGGNEERLVRIKTGKSEWLFQLTCREFKCAIRKISGPH